jgi:hypothetical protein
MKAMSNKQVVQDYLDAVEKVDFKRVRSLLSNTGHFGRTQMSADDFVKSMQSEAPWKGIHVLKELYDGDNVALLYEGTNATTGQPLEAIEFLTITNGQITEARGVILGGVLAGKGTSSFSMQSVVSPI